MEKVYQLYGVNTAMQLLRPNAKWEISNTSFTRWEDPRPCPTWEEVWAAMEKIKEMEDAIQTIWTKEQQAELKEQMAYVRGQME